MCTQCIHVDIPSPHLSPELHPTSRSTFWSYSTDTPDSTCPNLHPTAHKTYTTQQPFLPQITPTPACRWLRTESLVMLDSSFSRIPHPVHKQIPWLFKIHAESEQIIVHSYNGILAMRKKTTSHPTNKKKVLLFHSITGMNLRRNLSFRSQTQKRTYYLVLFIEVQDQAKSVHGDEGQNSGNLSEGMGGTQGNLPEC